MPDSLGRLNFLEMRQTVWRNLAACYPSSVDVATGQEIGDLSFDPLFTKQDVDRCLNEALTARTLDLTENADAVFADEETVNVFANIQEYHTPDDMAFLRGLWWKDPSVPLSQAPFSARVMMLFMDEQSSGSGWGMVGSPGVWWPGVPTYRRQIDMFVLNEAPPVDNPGGILVRYIKWANFLWQDEQVIETEFARVLQEIVVIDAAIALAGRKSFMDASSLADSRARWENRLVTAGRSSNSPPFARMVHRSWLQLFR